MQITFLSLTKSELFRLLAAFLFGLLLGALIVNLITAKQIDQLIYENTELNKKIDNQQTELQRLEESLADQNWRVVQRVQVAIESEEDKYINQQLEAKLYQLLENIIGRQISEVDGTLVANTVDQRTIVIEENNYLINLIWLILQEETVLKVEATKQED
ncbi:hypothetical protein [Fuchsiella alkaliacetigena]|uniref:hypothetical protein n=1 Tax=Fuchsiella alkaliacetigena TaxID=957042 RepID=UPI00200B46D2|nr:hypothetical protein [Fuchsiella alkaliacetigena]MCK8825558.1 hypothetical protein [Fuchsiella alkaliacetigena]